ncbi:MAG: dTDP-4-dehydrorhamnose reductase [candidate division WOR-3 bacterium]
MARILVTGARGMLGSQLCPQLRECGHEVIEWDLPEFDVTDVNRAIRGAVELRPSMIFHLAAYTDVDRAEEERALAYKVNTMGTWTMAIAARDSGATLIYLSTDYVFDGEKRSPYVEADPPHPINYYGLTKLLGEQAVERYLRHYFICRTSWLFGAGGRNFVDTILTLARERDRLDVVNDQAGSPTWTDDLSRALCQLAGSQQYGVYHITNSDVCTWFEFAREILLQAGLDVPLFPTTQEKYVRPARRPSYSVLDNSRFQATFGIVLPSWKEALRGYLTNMGVVK